MAKYKTLSDAMDARDELAEAEIRYRLLAESFEANPQLRANLSPSLDRVKAEIGRLRAMNASKPAAGESSDSSNAGKVVAFDATRFKKTTG
jgi:hypothetical protein